MWLPMLVQRLNFVDMQKEGLHLSAEELYSINHSSIKDAVVSLGGGFCTAEVVSSDGLLLTNHHCGFESIQKHSTVEKDYLTNGFWAMNRNEELPNEGLFASFLISMEDVTKKVLANVKSNMSESDRSAEIRKVSSQLKTDASEKGKYTVDVKSFYSGNEYYLFVYQIFEDIRLVGAPLQPLASLEEIQTTGCGLVTPETSACSASTQKPMELLQSMQRIMYP